MPSKVKDLAVKTGTYQNRAGETKNRYKNIGSIMQSDDGSQFILLDRTFNPAGVNNPDNRDTLLISIFDPREEGADPAPQRAPSRAAQQHTQAKGNGFAPQDIDDDLPF